MHKIKSHMLFIIILVFVGALRYYSYILFHTSAELFSIIVAFTIFVTAWNTRDISENDYLFFLGIAYFCIGLLDLAHTLSYKDMNIFPGYGSNLPVQLWVAARALESLSLLVAPFYVGAKLKRRLVFPLFLSITLLLFISIFIIAVFPECWIEGLGLTPFKKYSEYVISLFLFFAVFTLRRKRESLGASVYHFILLSIIVSIVSEVLFTVNNDAHWIFDMSGHLIKAASYYFVYRAMIKITLIDPFNSLFREILNRENNLRQLIDKSPIPMMITRERTIIEFINSKFTEIFGYSLSEMDTTDKWWELLTPNEVYRVETRRKLNVDIDRMSINSTEIPMQEMILTDRNGVEHYCHFYIVFIGGMSLSIIEDYSQKIRLENERKQLEELAVRNEKMLSLGRLSAGTAHEINNPLAGMMQALYVLNNRLLSNRDQKANIKAAEEVGTSYESIIKFMNKRSIPRMIDSINHAGQRISNIVDNMLFFTEDDKMKKTLSDIYELTEKILEITSTDPDMKKIELKKDYEENLPKVFCVSSRIQQVLLNMLRNSKQALLESQQSDRFISLSIRYLKKEEKVKISIADNGPGMTKEVLKNVFDPFFTTREVGSGTGLGLSVSYFIITEIHNGEISVQSEPGHGTTFVITLPVS